MWFIYCFFMWPVALTPLQIVYYFGTGRNITMLVFRNLLMLPAFITVQIKMYRSESAVTVV